MNLAAKVYLFHSMTYRPAVNGWKRTVQTAVPLRQQKLAQWNVFV
jgi:hypothetical protein